MTAVKKARKLTHAQAAVVYSLAAGGRLELGHTGWVIAVEGGFEAVQDRTVRALQERGAIQVRHEDTGLVAVLTDGWAL